MELTLLMRLLNIVQLADHSGAIEKTNNNTNNLQEEIAERYQNLSLTIANDLENNDTVKVDNEEVIKEVWTRRLKLAIAQNAAGGIKNDIRNHQTGSRSLVYAIFLTFVAFSTACILAGLFIFYRQQSVYR